MSKIHGRLDISWTVITKMLENGISPHGYNDHIHRMSTSKDSEAKAMNQRNLALKLDLWTGEINDCQAPRQN